MNVPSFIRKFLFPLSWLYGIGVFLRNYFYDAGLLKSTKVSVPVISVGNIFAGGTGKTPHLEYIANVLLLKNTKVAIISRGYKRSTKGTFIVSDGKNIYGTSLECGDESYMLALKFPKAILIVDEDRVRAANIAIEQFFANVIVLDDGFQHRALKRDVDIVLLDSTQENSGLLPSGNRRDSWRSLRRSNILIFSRWNNTAGNNVMVQRVKKFTSAKVLKTTFETMCINNFHTKKVKPIEALRNNTVLAFCGIGNPNSFRAIIESKKAIVNDFITFRDHHLFSEIDIKHLFQLYSATKVSYVLTTEKDAVRLTDNKLSVFVNQLPLWILPIETKFVEGEEIILQELQKQFPE